MENTPANNTPDVTPDTAPNPDPNVAPDTATVADSPIPPIEPATPETKPGTETPTPESTPETETETPTSEPTSETETPTPEPAPEPTPEAPSLEPSAEDSVISGKSEKKSRKPLLFCLLALLFLGAGSALAYYLLVLNPAKPVETSETSVSEEPLSASKLRLSGNSLSDFDLAFLKLHTSESKNQIYSPISLKYALAMLKDGSNGNSKTQIENLIGDYTPKAYLNSENRSLANAMMIREDFRNNVLPSYTNLLSEKYNAEVIYDSFASPDNVNRWISDKTLGIIDNMFDETTVNSELDYMLVNALAIDMNWNNQLQCFLELNPEHQHKVPCIDYSVKYSHENFHVYIPFIYETDDFSKISFNNGPETAKAAEIGANANRYDILTEIGEEKIRETVSAEYKKWLTNLKDDPDYQRFPDAYHTDFDLDAYISELDSNYGAIHESTDFAFAVTDSEKIFVKDLKEYDGATLEYVGIMPKSASLADYVSSLSAEKAQSLIDSAKDASSLETYSDGVVTKLSGYIPFFKFNDELELIPDLAELGVSDVFDTQLADLSGMLDIDEEILASDHRPYINVALHKADINFSNDGISAAAVTGFGGKGAGGGIRFDYDWDVPVEEIDLTFDRPFLFLIRDKSSGEIWFTGSVTTLE